jgi:hypothetical protein
MKVEITIPVKVVVEYDMDDTPDGFSGRLMKSLTSEVIKDRIIGLMDDSIVDDLTELTGLCVRDAHLKMWAGKS